MKNKLLIAGVLAAIAIPSAVLAQPYDPGCIRSNEDNRAAGTVVGGVAGALLGSAIAGRGSRGAGAVVGGVTGAVAGNAIAGSNDHPCPAGYYYRGPPPPPGGGGFWYGAPAGIHQRIDFVQSRIDTSASRGWISPHEADRLNRELNSIRDQDRDLRYRDGGHLSPSDRDDLQSRLDDVSQRLHWAHDRD